MTTPPIPQEFRSLFASGQLRGFPQVEAALTAEQQAAQANREADSRASATVAAASPERLRALTQQRFEDVRAQQAKDRVIGAARGQEIFGEGSLGRVEEGRSAEVSDLLQQRRTQQDTGSAGIQQALARRQQTIASGGQDPAFLQISEAAQRSQDVQTQTSLRQLRGQLGAQRVSGGINIQNQIRTLGQSDLAQAQLQAQLAQARLGRVSEAETAADALQQNLAARQTGLLGLTEQSVLGARAGEAQRADVNVQRALQERLGRLSLEEATVQQGLLERGAASQEVTAATQLQSQLSQQQEANRIARIAAEKPNAPATVVEQGGKLLCTEIHRQGLLDDALFAGDLEYAKGVSEATKVGYWSWARPLTKKLKESKVLTKMVTPFVRAWATEMAFKTGFSQKGSVFGKIMCWTFEPACYLLGKIILSCREHAGILETYTSEV